MASIRSPFLQPRCSAWQPSVGRSISASAKVTARGKAASAFSTEDVAWKALESIEVNLDKFPEAEYFQVTAVLRPWRLNSVVQSLSTSGIRGLTVSDVAGIGYQGGMERYGGTEFGANDLVQKKKLEVVCVREQVDSICQCIASTSFTGEIGDGKIFIAPVADIIRIRTAETGRDAERMTGGRSDILETLRDSDADS